MRILVVSDTHGGLARLRELLELHAEADMLIHLGDGARDYDAVKEGLGIPSYFVAGNCDWRDPRPSELLIEAGGKRIFIAHGHTRRVKFGLLSITLRARELCADVCLFGHTHCSLTDYADGLYIMNPGSLGHPSQGRGEYGMLDIINGQIVPIACFIK